MRQQQIIAAVTRALQLAGVREISSVDTFARLTGLHLCMACVSPGMHSYSGSHVGWSDPDSPSLSLWTTNGEPGGNGKRKRLPLAGIGRSVLRGIADLRLRNG